MVAKMTATCGARIKLGCEKRHNSSECEQGKKLNVHEISVDNTCTSGISFSQNSFPWDGGCQKQTLDPPILGLCQAGILALVKSFPHRSIISSDISIGFAEESTCGTIAFPRKQVNYLKILQSSNLKFDSYRIQVLKTCAL